MIETERLILYVVEKELYESLKNSRPTKGIIPLEGWPPRMIEKLIKEDLKKFKQNPELSIWGTYVAVNRETGEIVGDVGFKGPPDYSGEVEIGYGINENHRRKGYGFEAAKGLMDFALSNESVDACIAECKKNNEVSIKIMEKLGMDLYDEDRKYLYYRRNK